MVLKGLFEYGGLLTGLKEKKQDWEFNDETMEKIAVDAHSTKAEARKGLGFANDRPSKLGKDYEGKKMKFEDEEEEEEVRETILGVAPELASFLAEEKNFAFFLGRIRTLSQQKSAEERKQDQPCAQKKRVTEEEEQNAEERLREEEEERKRAEQAAAKRREEEWLKGSEELRVLRDMFPTCAVAELKLRLDVANGDLQEAIERTVEMIEFSEGLVSKEELQAEREAFEAEAREAMRERALTYYSEVKESEKGETGKKVDPRGALHKSADFDREVQRALAAEKVTRRFINNEVVAHKGERFIMEKTRNAVPEDPKSFIGLKIKSKKKGPSPNFK
mmetsp:Transcript_48524/g.115175  ORF Transcript_48524/g.115175 Transcript_48524/m.115175 type:complete len:334 (+) Transcript_48524:1916-2917(+)